MNASDRLGSAPLFAAGRTWTVDDAIAFAAFRGELRDAIEETLALAAAEARVAEEGAVIGDDVLQARSDAFRYEHGLISAGETESWLSDRGLSADDFGRWIYQNVCRDGYAASAAPTPPDFADLLRIHLWLSGGMDSLAQDLGRRVAATRELEEKGEPISPTVAIAAFLKREGIDSTSLPQWLESLGRDERWLEETATRESAFERLASTAVSAEARARSLATMQRMLTRIEFDLLEVDSEGAVREAFLCVHDDHLPLADVAREAGYRLLRREACLEDLGDDAERLFGAAVGEVVPPIESAGRFRLYQVLRKQPPSLSDPVIAKRIDGLILDEFFSDLTARHIEPRQPARVS